MADDPAVKFICDVHLGKLARLLRLLGFDTIYRNDLEDWEIIRIARAEQRLALTRDREILGNRAIRSYRPRSIFPEEQIREVVTALDLARDCRPFSRCLICNGDILPADKSVRSGGGAAAQRPMHGAVLALPGLPESLLARLPLR